MILGTKNFSIHWIVADYTRRSWTHFNCIWRSTSKKHKLQVWIAAQWTIFKSNPLSLLCIWSWSHYYYGKSKLKCLILFCDPSRFSQYKDTIYCCKVTDLTFATRKSARIPFPPKSSLPRATVSRARSVFHACNKSKNENTHISQTKKAFCDWNKDSCSNKFLDKWTRWCNW